MDAVPLARLVSLASAARLVLFAVTAVIGLSSCFLWTKSSTEVAQDTELIRQMPGKLEINKPFTGEVRTARVRIWVDDDFRSQNVRWRAQIEEQLDEANQFLAPAVGLRLEVAEMKPWPVRQVGVGLREVLVALEALDDGKGADWVLGYTSSLTLVESRFEELGVARLLGRHLVVRGYADVTERKRFERHLPETSREDREVVHQARRRHKQGLVLIHEIAHTLGAVHERDTSWIMHASYDVKMTQLSDRSRELMQLTLEGWLGATGGGDARARAARLVSFIESNPWGGWEENDLRDWIASLHAVADASEAGDGAAPVTPDIPVPPGAYEQYQRAQRLAQQGQRDDALAELAALVTAYPASAELRQAICEVHIGKDGPGHATTTATCDRAAEISPDDPRPYLARVQGHIAGGTRKPAIALLAQVEARAGERAPVWDEVATVYQVLGLVTHAERAAARSTAIAKPTTPHPVTVWAGRTRARYGLPPDARRWKIAVDDEGEYVTAVRELLDLVYANKPARVATQAAAAEKRWKGAPGILAARCDLHLRQGELPRARPLCKQAIAGWAGAAWAQYLAGVIAFQDGQPKVAVGALRRAIAADPELAQAYRALAKALKVTGDKAGRQALATEYTRRFGSGLPD